MLLQIIPHIIHLIDLYVRLQIQSVSIISRPFRPLYALCKVSFRGDGLLNGIQTIAEATGQVKGKVGNPLADPPLQSNGKLDVGGAVGKGELKKHLALKLASVLPLSPGASFYQ